MKKNMKVLVSVMLILALMTVSTYAGGVIKDVMGKENPNLKIKYNGETQVMKDGKGTVVYPVVINGTTYLPVRSVATMMGADISYDAATQTITIISAGNDDGALPTDLPPTTPKVPETPKVPTPTVPTTGNSTNSGTFEDPVAFGKSFSWKEVGTVKGYGFKSDMTVTVKSVKPLTDAEIEKLGFRRDDDQRIGYVMIELSAIGRNVTATNIDSDSIYYSATEPNIWGSVAPKSDMYIIGGTDYGFDGSMSRNLSDRYESNKISKGGTIKEINYSGKLILPIVKGEENYLVLQRQNYELETNARKIFFKLQ